MPFGYRHYPLGSFAGNNDDVAFLGNFERPTNGFPAVGYCLVLGVLDAVLDFTKNGFGVLTIRVFARKNNVACELVGDAAQLRPFPLVPAAAGRAENGNYLLLGRG